MPSLPGTSAFHLRETVRLSAPVMIGQLGIILMGVVDNMMVGWLSYQDLSASSLANSLYFIITVIPTGITFAISPLVAEADAAGRGPRCGRFLRQGMWVSLVSSVLSMLILELTIYFLPHMGQPPGDVALATPYLRLLNWSTLPMIWFLTYKQYTDGLSFTRVAMMVTLVGLLVNVLANWLLIFGNWGFPRWELNGAGVATLLSRVVMLAAIVWYVHRSRNRKQGGLPPGSWRPHLPTIRKIVAIGLPSGLQFFFEVGAFSGAVIMIGWLGAVPRSAHQIVINLASVSYMVVTGLAAGATIRVGNARGRNDLAEARKAGVAGFWLGGLFMCSSAIVFILGRNWFPLAYNNHPEVLAMAAQLMLMASLFQIFDGLQAVGIGILRGLQDVNLPTVMALVCYWIVGLPVGYLVGFELNGGVIGVWVGFVTSLGLASVLFFRRFFRLTETT